MVRSMVAALMLLVSTVAAGGRCIEPISTRLLPNDYPSPWHALREIREQVVDVSRRRDVEFAGGMLRGPDGRYQISLGRGCAGRDAIAFRVGLPAGGELVAFWHTHGARGDARTLFSAADADVVERFGLPFYLIDASGLIRVLAPENLVATRVRRTRGSALRDGRIYRGQLAAGGHGSGDSPDAAPRGATRR